MRFCLCVFCAFSELSDTNDETKQTTDLSPGKIRHWLVLKLSVLLREIYGPRLDSQPW